MSRKQQKYTMMVSIIMALCFLIGDCSAQCWFEVLDHKCFEKQDSCVSFDVSFDPVPYGYRFRGSIFEIRADKDVLYEYWIDGQHCSSYSICDAGDFKHGFFIRKSCEITKRDTVEVCDRDGVNTLGYIQNCDGCDTIVRTHVIVLPNHVTSDTAHFCDSEVEDFEKFLFNEHGCDSVVEVTAINHLSSTFVLKPTFGLEQDTVILQYVDQFGCDSFTLQIINEVDIDNGELLVDLVVPVSGDTIIPIQIKENDNIFIPDALSPYGENSRLILFSDLEGEPKKVDYISIYLRWGGEIFHASNFLTNTELNWIPEVGDYMFKASVEGKFYSGSITVIN